MADDYFGDIMTSADQIRANHEAYKDKYVESGTSGIDSETFLKLLVAEMSNQDPLEPTSNTEFISQLAQFSAMGYMQTAGKYAQANYASSLVGKTVSASKVDGKDVVIVTGVVQKVTPNKDGSSYTVTIDGEDFDLSKVTAVIDPNTSTDLVGSSILADRVAQAASMVGMYAEVKTGVDDDGNEVTTEGLVLSIIVKGTDIKVLIDDVAYDISDIRELTAAYFVENPEDPDNPEDPEKPGDDDKVDGVDGSENAGSSGGNGGTDDVTENGNVNNDVAAAANFTTGAEDIPDLSDDDAEMARQLQEIINSMS